MKSFRKIWFAIIGLGAAALAACNTGPEMGNPQDVAQVGVGMNSYRLGAGDEIKITVFGEADLSGAFTVDGEGAISMQLIGQIPVANTTLAETSALIEKKLKDGKLLLEPRVTTEMVKGRPYYILGEVNKPSEYPFSPGLTVMNAITRAGGFTYRADQGKILIKSADSPNEREVVLTPTTAVRPGDTIRIRERFF